MGYVCRSVVSQSGQARVPQLGPDLVSCEVGDFLEDGGGGWCGAGAWR